MRTPNDGLGERAGDAISGCFSCIICEHARAEHGFWPSLRIQIYGLLHPYRGGGLSRDPDRGGARDDIRRAVNELPRKSRLIVTSAGPEEVYRTMLMVASINCWMSSPRGYWPDRPAA